MDFLETKLKERPLSPRCLLSRARLIDTAEWNAEEMTDPNGFPFYYHLGKTLENPKNLLEFGFGNGLTSSSLLQGCPSIEEYHGFQLTNNDFYYTFRFGYATLKEYFKGTIDLKSGDNQVFYEMAANKSWDIVALSVPIERNFYYEYLNKAWANCRRYLIVNHIKERHDLFSDWCQSKNLESKIYASRFGLAIVERQ